MTAADILLVAAGVATMALLVYLIHRFSEDTANSGCQQQAMIAALLQSPGMGPMIWPGLYLPMGLARRPVLVTIKSKSVGSAA